MIIDNIQKTFDKTVSVNQELLNQQPQLYILFVNKTY